MYNRIHKIYLTLLHYPRMSFPLHVCSPLGPKEKPDFRVEKRVERHLTGNDKFSFWLRFWPSVCSNLWRMKSIMLNIMQYHTVPLHRKRESLYTFIVSEKNLFIAFNNFSFHSFFSLHFLYFFQLNCCCICAKSYQPRLKCWCTWWKKLWMNRSVLNIIIKKLFYSCVTRKLMRRGWALLIFLANCWT